MEYDVVVVGAGPSGSTAARECAKKGFKTLLVDKERLPRYKTCGGGVTVKAENALDFKLPGSVIQREIHETRLYHKGRYIKHESEGKLISMVDRGEFDKLLADAAVDGGAELLENTRVGEVAVDENGCRVNAGGREIHTAIVIGADGVNSTVASRVRPPFRKDEVLMAYEAEIPVDRSIIDARGGVAETYLDCDCWGYGWVFPKRDHLSVGLGGILSRFRNSRSLLDRFVRARGLSTEGLQVHAHLIPVGSDRRSVASDRVMLVGDAAGFTEPFTGEGIYYAIRSAQLAAETVTHAYERSDFSRTMLQGYQEKCRLEFMDEFRRAWKAVRAFFMFKPLSVRVLFGNREIADHFARIQSGRETYREFKKWALPRAPYFLLKSLLPQ